MSNPLFRRAEKALMEAARQDAMVKQLSRALSTLRGSSRSVMRGAKRVVREMEGQQDVDRYGKISEFVRTQIIDEVIRQLGPVGGLLGALIRPQGRSIAQTVTEEINAAVAILQQLAATPDTQPQTSGSGGGNRRTPREVDAPSPAPEPEPIVEGPQRRQVIGRNYQFEPDDPIVTGEMIDVISSNVHSIGYDWNEAAPSQGTLKVRYLEKHGRKTRTRAAGPLYLYHKVHPEVFMAFQQAASKGKFVWDRLRIRGTVSGTRFHYELQDTGSTNYIPRKAARFGRNEYFIRRQFQGRQSDLRDEFVRELQGNRGPRGFVPNRGAPNRGTPNRGTPNRGR